MFGNLAVRETRNGGVACANTGSLTGLLTGTQSPLANYTVGLLPLQVVALEAERSDLLAKCSSLQSQLHSMDLGRRARRGASPTDGSGYDDRDEAGSRHQPADDSGEDEGWSTGSASPQVVHSGCARFVNPVAWFAHLSIHLF